MVPIVSRLETGAQGGDNGSMEATIEIHLNGASHVLAGACSVAALLDATGHGGRRVAVEVNGEIVPRSRHDAHLLHDGDVVELVQALGGG